MFLGTYTMYRSLGYGEERGRKSFHHCRLFSTGIANLSISLMIVVNRWGNGYEAVEFMFFVSSYRWLHLPMAGIMLIHHVDISVLCNQNLQ